MITKQEKNTAVDINIFTKNFTLETAYILGLLWADGSFITSGNQQEIRLECLETDMKHFSKILDKTGNWNYYSRTRKNEKGIDKKPVIIARTRNKVIIDFLRKKDFFDKSLKSPDKIIKALKTKELISTFVLGVVDGDGCFYFNQKYGLRQFTITGSKNQDWIFFEKLFTRLDIKYKINRKKNKTQGYSQIRVLNRENIKRLGDFIYNSTNVEFGLNRKQEKYLDIIK